MANSLLAPLEQVGIISLEAGVVGEEQLKYAKEDLVASLWRWENTRIGELGLAMAKDQRGS